MASKISALYEGRWLSNYVYWKIRIDPVYAAVAQRLEQMDRPLLDLGCGLGVLEFYLRESGIDSPITGLDRDEDKIDAARRVAANYTGLTFESGFLTELDQIPGHVALIDVIHYLDDDLQQRLLRSIGERLTEGSRVILRQTLADRGWRSRVTWLGEVFARITGWNLMSTINVPTLESIDACFPAERFDRYLAPLWGRTPFNGFLLEYRRRPDGPAPSGQGDSRSG